MIQKIEVTIKVINYDEEGNYKSSNEVYSQTLEKLNISKLAVFLNTNE